MVNRHIPAILRQKHILHGQRKFPILAGRFVSHFLYSKNRDRDNAVGCEISSLQYQLVSTKPVIKMMRRIGQCFCRLFAGWFCVVSLFLQRDLVVLSRLLKRCQKARNQHNNQFNNNAGTAKTNATTNFYFKVLSNRANFLALTLAYFYFNCGLLICVLLLLLSIFKKRLCLSKNM